MWSIIIFSLLVIFITFLFIKNFIKNEKDELYFKIVLIVLNISLIFLSLFSFYLLRSFSVIGAFIYGSLGIVIISFNILFVMTKIIQTKKINISDTDRRKIKPSARIKQLFFLMPIVFPLLFSFLIMKYQLSEKIALRIEFKRYKNELDSYITNNVKNKNIRIFNNYVGIIWDPGFLDNYSVIIYDKNNNLDVLYNSSEDTVENKEIYNEFKKAFAYDRIVDLIKIEDNYFRCNIHE